MIEMGATFSPCRTWRYSLTRRWAHDGPLLMVIGLNPSTADETQDDPTIRRCIGFAKREGMTGLVMANLFAFRATDPRTMRRADDPIGPDNDMWLSMLRDLCDLRLAAWGVHGHYRDRARDVMERGLLSHVYCLGLTKGGTPRHPLYLAADTPLEPFHGDPV
jgi:hypothetical protein